MAKKRPDDERMASVAWRGDAGTVESLLRIAEVRLSELGKHRSSAHLFPRTQEEPGTFNQRGWVEWMSSVDQMDEDSVVALERFVLTCRRRLGLDDSNVAVNGRPREIGTKMRDFFISYNSNDKHWAEWIAWKLEEAGYTTVFQAWDFRAGGDFVMEMQKAATGTKRTIAVLSDNYLNAEYTQPEWGNAFARDPQGHERTLIPVRISQCKPPGLLATRIYVDLVGLSENDARNKLVKSLSDRGKPATAPPFPGTSASSEPTTVHPPRSFPGRASSAIGLWQEKLEFLQQQEAVVSDPAQKFALNKQIEECERKIRELGGNPQ